jgi:hypothetical protein
VLVNYIREYQIDHGVERAQAYSITMYILAGLLAFGFLCNWLVSAVNARYHMAAADSATPARANPRTGSESPDLTSAARTSWLVPAAWAAVWIPIGWGVWITLQKAVLLFR